jgi:hypothetical protein
MAAVIIGLQCPSPACHATGCTENWCIQCQRIPPSLTKTPARIHNSRFITWAKDPANKGKPESDFKGNAYQDTKVLPVTHGDFWDFVRKNQNQLTIPRNSSM